MSTPMKRGAESGFTLVELMVAMTAGIIAVSGAYVLSANSTRNISEQMRLADTQMSLRTAMDQVRRDFGRAGYLATRNVATMPPTFCGVATSTLVVNDPTTGAPPAFGVSVNAASIYVDGSLDLDGTGAATEALLNHTTVAGTDANLTRADVVVLQGSYQAGTMFPVSNVGFVDSRVIEVDNTSTTFQMVFSDAPAGGGAGVYDPNRFEDTFARGRAVRFESDGRFYFRLIESSNGAVTPPTVTLAAAGDPLPDIGCAPRAGAFVSVISQIVYELNPINGGSDLSAETPNDLVALNHRTIPVAQLGRAWKRTALVRREISYETSIPMVPSTASLVLDNAVEFQVNAIRNTAAPGDTPVFQRLTGALVETVSTTAATAGQLRALLVTLSARAVEGEQLPMHRNRLSLDDPMLSFQMGTFGGPTFFVARVRTARAEIFLPNMVD